MAKAKFKVYSKRVDEFTKQLCFGLSQTPIAEGDPADFGTGKVWGEIQINCDQGTDAADAFEIGDIVHVTFDNQGLEEEAAPAKTRRQIVDEDDDDDDDDATKETKKAATAVKTTTPKKA